MTPAALTTAARDAGKRRKPAPKSARPAPDGNPASTPTNPRAGGAVRTSSAHSAGHRAPARGSAAPRRVSGPVTGAPRPRRVSGPVRGGTIARPVVRRPGPRPFALPGPADLAARASAFVRTLPDHRLLDRVVRGRSWIPILGLLLTGIVAMQVETLRLGASTGRSLERVTALQSLNQQLRASVAVLGDDQRIERLAAGMSMVMPGPTQVRFLASHGAPVNRALGSVHAPDAATFLAGLPSTASIAAVTGTRPAATLPASAAAAPVGSTAAPAVTAGVPATAAASTGAAAPGVAPSSAAAVPTAPSATNTGVAGTGSSAASSPTASSGAPAAVTPASPTATTPNGAAGVPSGG